MTPDHLPDDSMSSERARVAAMCQQTMALVGKLECELLAARAEVKCRQQALELAWVKNAELAQWLIALKSNAPNDWADMYEALRAERDVLRAVAEAAKAFAKSEWWDFTQGGGLVFGNRADTGDLGLRITLARALLAAGMDWRATESA